LKTNKPILLAQGGLVFLCPCDALVTVLDLAMNRDRWQNDEPLSVNPIAHNTRTSRPAANDANLPWLTLALGLFFMASGLLLRKSWREVSEANERAQNEGLIYCPLAPIEKFSVPEPNQSDAILGCFPNSDGAWRNGNHWCPPTGHVIHKNPAVHAAVTEGLDWLAAQQSEYGSWEVNALGRKRDGDNTSPTDEVGNVGATSLALLAFLGDGSTTKKGKYRAVVQRAVKWLGQQQDVISGLIETENEELSAIDHGIASLALAENYYDSHNPFQKLQVQRALRYIEYSQNLDGGWHQEKPCREALDTLLASWNILALVSGADTRLHTNPHVLEQGLAWLDAHTDSDTGRIGLDSSITRTPLNSEGGISATMRSATMTRAGWLAKIMADRPVESHSLIDLRADQLLNALPAWSSDGSVDMCGWFLATHLMFQMAGEHWERWNKALEQTLLPHQSMGETLRGSWPPMRSFGMHGGRVQSTALALLALQVSYRHLRVIELAPEH
jgi:hypothetical protein